jgi:hypothetical protein
MAIEHGPKHTLDFGSLIRRAVPFSQGHSARSERSRPGQRRSGISMLLAWIEMWPPPCISMFSFS